MLVPLNESWSSSHIWLHKQPLFLWQMAFFVKIFGASEMAIRIPDIIAHGLLLLMIYDLGYMIKNKLTGFLAAIVFAYMRFPLIYAAGIEATDHNDYMFLFYVTASFWAYFKYESTSQIKFLILLGVFTGFAVLVKWLTGFLVIGVWYTYLFLFERKSINKATIALVVAIIISFPWQLYCYLKYPTQFLREMTFNAEHVTKALEGHEGPWYYHFIQLQNLYADDYLIYVLLFGSILWFALKSKASFKNKYVILVSIIVVYTFFSFAQTKMPAFCSICIPLIIIIIMSAVVDISDKISGNKAKSFIYIIVTVVLSSYFMNPSYFLKRHTLTFRPEEHKMYKNLHDKMLVNGVKEIVTGKNAVLMNCGGLAVKVMFYADCDATDMVLTKDIIDKLKKSNYKIIAFRSGLPDYVLNDPEIIKIGK